jgi:DNA-binding SARP family transcriptional activator/TolB-like protein
MKAPLGIKVRLLGRFAVTIDGEPPAPMRISSRKGRALLAYLAMHPEHCAGREQLATLLWGDRPDQQARLSLRQCILSLRTDLAEAGDVLVFEADTVALRMHHVQVDALDFGQFAQSVTAEDLERAAHLYSGEFLSDLRIEAEAFASWIEAERTQLTTTAARVFENWMEALDIAGRGQQALNAADRLVALDPLREDWQRRMLRVYARHRGKDAALIRAKALIALLKVELEVEPEPATNALIAEIRSGAVPSAERPAAAPAESSPARSRDATGLDGQVSVAPPVAPDRTDREAATLVAEGRRQIPLFSPRIFRTSAIALALALLSIFIPVGFLAQRHLVWADRASNVAIAFPVPIGVLAFEPLDNGAGSRVAADLLSDDLINILSRVQTLKVVSRLGSHQKAGRPKDVATIGNELGVRYLLDGTVRIEEDRLHLNVELIDTRSGLQVWSNQFERGPAGSSATRQEVVRGLGRMLEVEMINLNKERIETRSSQPRKMEEVLAAGWGALYASAAADTLPLAEASFREALQRDPEQLSAMLGLAAHHIIAVGNLAVPQREPYLGDAEQLIERILLRRPESSAAYYYRGLLQKLRNEPQPALASFERSVALNPSFAPAYGQIGQVLTSLGRAEEGLEQIRYAMRLSPQDPTMPSWDIFAGQAELELGHDEEALQWLLRAVALSPNNRLANGALAAAYALAGDRATAELYTTKFKALTRGVSDERRLQLFGAFLPLPAPHRTADGLRTALGNSDDPPAAQSSNKL